MNDSSATHAGDEYQKDALPNDVRRVLVPGVGDRGWPWSDWSSLTGLCVARSAVDVQGEDGSALPEVSSAARVRGL